MDAPNSIHRPVQIKLRDLNKIAKTNLTNELAEAINGIAGGFIGGQVDGQTYGGGGIPLVITGTTQYKTGTTLGSGWFTATIATPATTPPDPTQPISTSSPLTYSATGGTQVYAVDYSNSAAAGGTTAYCIGVPAGTSVDGYPIYEVAVEQPKPTQKYQVYTPIDDTLKPIWTSERFID